MPIVRSLTLTDYEKGIKKEWTIISYIHLRQKAYLEHRIGIMAKLVSVVICLLSVSFFYNLFQVRLKFFRERHESMKTKW